MNKRIVALVLSFIYCGLGQIYNRQIAKGLDFIIVYTILIVFFFSSSPLLHFLGLSILPFMWFMGMVDAYVYEFLSEGKFIQKKRWLLIIASGIVFSALVVFIQILLLGKPSAFDRQNVISSVEQKVHTEVKSEPDSSQFFSIQAAAFKYLEEAEKFRDELLNKRYSARVERSTLTEEVWYRVLIGRFQTRQDAIRIAEELNAQEDISYMIVSRSIDIQ